MKIFVKFKVLMFTTSILLYGCATTEERELAKEQKLNEIKQLSDYELCLKVRIQNWPPTWRGGKGLFWMALEADYRNELTSRGVTPFLCSNASKRCVYYGYIFGTKDHRDCTLAEGQNIAVEQIEIQRRKSEEYKSFFNPEN